MRALCNALSIALLAASASAASSVPWLTKPSADSGSGIIISNGGGKGSRLYVFTPHCKDFPQKNANAPCVQYVELNDQGDFEGYSGRNCPTFDPNKPGPSGSTCWYMLAPTTNTYSKATGDAILPPVPLNWRNGKFSPTPTTFSPLGFVGSASATMNNKIWLIGGGFDQLCNPDYTDCKTASPEHTVQSSMFSFDGSRFACISGHVSSPDGQGQVCPDKDQEFGDRIYASALGVDDTTADNLPSKCRDKFTLQAKSRINMLYVFGGSKNGADISDVDIYVDGNGWCDKGSAAKMPRAQDRMEAAVMPYQTRHLFYVVGGQTKNQGGAGTKYHFDTSVYDPLANTWITLSNAHLPVKRVFAGIAALNCRVYVFGGSTLLPNGDVNLAKNTANVQVLSTVHSNSEEKLRLNFTTGPPLSFSNSHFSSFDLSRFKNYPQTLAVVGGSVGNNDIANTSLYKTCDAATTFDLNKRCQKCMPGYGPPGKCNTHHCPTASQCDGGCSGDHGKCSAKFGNCTCANKKFTGVGCELCTNDHYNPSKECADCTSLYYGKDCAKACPATNFAKKTTCSEHGVCSSGINGDGSCKCLANWNGDAACSTCTVNYDNRTRCQNCTFGWDLSSGCTKCSHNFDIKTKCTSCLGNYAFSSGCTQCLTGWDLASKCTKCAAGFYGSRCEQRCPGAAGYSIVGGKPTWKIPPCGGRGTCDDGLSGTGACKCQLAYQGSACKVCSPAYACEVNGQATSVGSKCDYASAGSASSSSYASGSSSATFFDTQVTGSSSARAAAQCVACVCQSVCKAHHCTGHGKCISKDSCECAANFQGNACQNCVAGKFGPQCAGMCPGTTKGGKSCSGNGHCDSGIRGSGNCTCTPGFEGLDCGTAINPSDSSGSSGLPVGGIVGIVAGCLVVVAGGFWGYKRYTSPPAEPAATTTAKKPLMKKGNTDDDMVMM